jgi:hypothetical protein
MGDEMNYKCYPQVLCSMKLMNLSGISDIQDDWMSDLSPDKLSLVPISLFVTLSLVLISLFVTLSLVPKSRFVTLSLIEEERYNDIPRCGLVLSAANCSELMQERNITYDKEDDRNRRCLSIAGKSNN